LARRATFVESLRVHNTPFVLLDGGDFIQRNQNRGELESITTWKDMQREGYDAVTLGEIELSQWDFTSSLMEQHPLPIVCTNVEQLNGDSWQQIGDRYRIVDIRGVKVGILSVIGEAQLSKSMIDKAGGAIRLLPPMETATEVARELRAKSDVVILLAHLDARTMEQYATVLTDVDVIVGGHVTRKDEGPKKFGNAIVNRSGTRGQHLGITRLILSPENEIVDFGGVNFTLAPTYPENEAIKAEVDRVTEESNLLKREKAKKTREERLKKAAAQEAAEADAAGKSQAGE